MSDTLAAMSPAKSVPARVFKKTTHELKIWPEHFADWLSGKKRAEIRQNDRNFRVGDDVLLMEYKPKTKKFTGREIRTEILHITELAKIPNLPNSKVPFVVLSLAARKITKSPA